MNERMKKLRDEMADKYRANTFYNADLNSANDFAAGFNSAYEMLMKDVSGLLEALEFFKGSEFNFKADEAIAEWRAKHGGGE